MPKWVKGKSGNPKGRLKALDTGLIAKQIMLKARAAGAEAIEVLIKEMREAPRSSERLTAAGMLLDRGFGKAVTAPDIAAIRQDLKRNLTAIVMGSPEGMQRLADLRRRLAQLEEFDPHRLIDAVAAPADDGAVRSWAFSRT
jgi:hypothetical protein